jgi:hypothetical protein
MLVCDDCQENRGRCGICGQDIYVRYANKNRYNSREWSAEFKMYAKFHSAAFTGMMKRSWRTIANIVDNPDACGFQELSVDCVTKPRLFYILNSVSCKETGDAYSTEFRKHIFRTLLRMCLSKKVLPL